MPEKNVHAKSTSAPWGLVGGFTRVPRDLRRAVAFVTLNPIAQLALIDFADAWDQAQHYTPLYLTHGKYIPVPHSETSVPCSRQHFAEALVQLERHGFVSRPDDDHLASAPRTRLRPVTAWYEFRPDNNDYRRLMAYLRPRIHLLTRRNARARDILTYYGGLRRQRLEHFLGPGPVLDTLCAALWPRSGNGQETE